MKKTSRIFGVLAAALVAAGLLATACEHTVSGPPAASETGRITVRIGVEGQESSSNAARTVYPNLSPDPFAKYELSFTPTSGGEVHDPVSVSNDSTTVELVVGTYTITATAYTGTEGAWVAVAEKVLTGVVVTTGTNSQVDLILGPKTGGADGTFAYTITLSDDITGNLYITTEDNQAVQNGTITLNTEGNNSSVSLAPGVYNLRVQVAKGTKSGGFSETLHIYTGLTSTLPAKTYTETDLHEAGEPETVSNFILTGRFTAPALGGIPASSFDGDQYTGTIVWKIGDTNFTGNAFAASTAYTAVVTLTAKTGFTFAGVGTDVFSHGTITGTNSVNDGIVTFIFPTTETAPPEKGSFAISIGFNYGNITVTGDTESNTITQPSGTLQLTVTGYGEIAWYVDENISPVSTENPVTLNAADYGIGAHNVTFKGKKEGITYSKVVLFVVAAAVPPPDGALTSVQAVASYLNSAPGGGSEAEPVSLVVAINLSEGGDPTNWAALVTAIDNADKFVDLDLSGCALNGTEFDPAKDTTSLNTGKAKIVSLVLPDTATSVKQAKTYSNGSFHEFSRIKSISGSGITAIDQYVFSGHQTLTTLNLPNVTSISGTSAVRGSTALTTVNLPKLASMGSFTFQDCTALTEVDLPQLTEVATTAFQGCAELARVNIPGVTSIKVQGFAKAFKANAAVTIVMGKTAPTLAGNIFNSVDSTVTVTVQVPANATGYNEAWKSDFLKGGGITSGNLSIVEQ